MATPQPRTRQLRTCGRPVDPGNVTDVDCCRQAREGGQWWEWHYFGPQTNIGLTVTALVSWARPCRGFRILRDGGGGRLVDHSADAVMLPLLAPGPGLDVRNRRCVRWGQGRCLVLGLQLV